MGDSSSSTNTSQSNTLNPWSQGQYGNLSGQIQNTLGGNYGGSYTPYGQPMTAGLTQTQQQAQGIAENNLGAGQGLLGQASQGATSGASYSPQSVGPQSLASTNLQPYMNPYTQDVTNATMNSLNLQNQQAINNEASQFTGAGAFGGARQGVADAQTNNLFANTAAQTLSALNQANYTNAQQAAQGDISNNLQGQLSNQQAGLQGENLNLGASGLLGNLAGEQQQLGANAANELNQFGQQQQQTNNAALQAAYQEYLRGQISPSQQLQSQLGLLGETPMLTNSKGAITTTSSPSMLSDMGALFGGGANSLFSGLSSAGSGLAGLFNSAPGVVPTATPIYGQSFSDERTKENVVTIGRDAKARRWVSYSYRNDPTRHVGVIAQEVQKTDPDAVIEHPLLGLLMVDYSKLREAA